MRREQLPPDPKRSFVIDRYKVAYVSTPKVACTSLKWVVAELAGEDLATFSRVTRPGTTPAGTIHLRRNWRRTRRLHQLSDAELAGIDEANGWLVFAVVRHPTSRLWSAWQQKVLLREPFVLPKVPADLLAEVPRSTGQVVEAFRRFVLALASGDAGGMTTNPHFRPQEELLAVDRMPYTRIYPVAELEQLLRDLDEQVRGHGGGPVPALRSTNETPLKPLRSMFTDEVLAAVEQLYRGDFRRWFGDADPVPAGALPDDEYSPSQLAEVGRLVDRHERIGQVSAVAEELRQENEALRERLDRTTATR